MVVKVHWAWCNPNSPISCDESVVNFCCICGNCSSDACERSACVLFEMLRAISCPARSISKSPVRFSQIWQEGSELLGTSSSPPWLQWFTAWIVMKTMWYTLDLPHIEEFPAMTLKMRLWHLHRILHVCYFCDAVEMVFGFHLNLCFQSEQSQFVSDNHCIASHDC